METIVYYAKYYGVKSKNLPRDAVGNVQFDNGLSYSIDFNAAFVEDMNPDILIDFNYLYYEFWKTKKHNINIYDMVGYRVNMTPAQSAIVALETDGSSEYEVFGYNNQRYPVNGAFSSKQTKTTWNGEKIEETINGQSKLQKTPGRFAYKLKWRGDDII
jgi:hypothetical protein